MEYLDKLIGAMLAVLTIEQWKALGFLTMIASAVTETVKRVFLQRANAYRFKQTVYAVSFAVGVAAGVLGWMMAGTAEVPNYYWLTFGVIAGPIANFVHWLIPTVVGWKFPTMADRLKGVKR